MTKLIVKELEPLQNLIDEASILKLEDFFINTDLTSNDKRKLVGIIQSISPTQKLMIPIYSKIGMLSLILYI